MIALLHGAKKNVGDFLIYSRCRDLLTHFLGYSNFLVYERWKVLDDHIDEINKADGIVLCGGPLYASNMYPGALPFVSFPERIKVPVIPVGVGWHSKRHYSYKKFRFDKRSYLFIRRIHSNIEFSGVRCPDTLSIMKKCRINNALLSGCPAIYDLKSIGTPFKIPKRIERLIVSDPANIFLYPKVVRLIREIRYLLPDAEINLCFHRGIKKDCYTSRKASIAAQLLKTIAKMHGCLVHDVSSSIDNIQFYQDCDLHIGFRVHAHVYFASTRKPTFLLQEDGRGIGMSKLIGVGDVNAKESLAITKIMGKVKQSVEIDFRNFSHIPDIIDSLFLTMEKVIVSNFR